MSPKAKWEYMRAIYERYRDAKGRKAKSLILDEFCKTYQCTRTHAKRLMNGPEPEGEKPKRRRRGSQYTSGRLISILEAAWKTSEYMCGPRLKQALLAWMPVMRKRFSLSRREEGLLGSISSATIDRQLKPFKDKMGRKLYGTTKRGTLLKHHIPVKTEHWNVDRPGYTEIDLVSHSGDSGEGDFAHSLSQVDILTTWVELRCVPNKSQEVVCRALDEIRHELPFELLGIDSDNGSEFINDHLWSYSQQAPRIQFTRGRAYKKDDNAHVEQKNWTHVRKPLGYGRYDTPAAVAAINDLYRHELRWFRNLFQPSMKLAAKVRVGAKVRRRYDTPSTPLDRLIASGHGKPEKIAELKRLRDSLDPFVLAQAIEHKLARIWAMRSKVPQPVWVRTRVIPSYRRKPLEGPPMEPETRPAMQTYERLHAKETQRQTWS